VKVQRGIREWPIERDESQGPRETETGCSDRQSRGQDPNPDPGTVDAATTERTPCDRVLPDEREDERDARDTMRDIQNSGGGVREEPGHDPRHEESRDRREKREVR